MHCTERDQEILLLQHGELGAWQAFWVERHIAFCPHCQEKQREFAQTSLLLAGAIRQDGGLPAFAMRGASQIPQASFRPIFIATVGMVAALIAAGTYAYNAVASTPQTEMEASIAPKLASPFASYPANKNAKDAQGRATIFPYSTPTEPDNCVIVK
ncbi:MAG: hypothetical protein H7Y38_11700 [Armatimonadetes bacterium]|nr:hypothetical protein [Armatimonadota bacterium]